MGHRRLWSPRIEERAGLQLNRSSTGKFLFAVEPVADVRYWHKADISAGVPLGPISLPREGARVGAKKWESVVPKKQILNDSLLTTAKL